MTETTDSKFDAHYDAMLPFLKEFEGESDRASIVLGAARLDLALEGLLRRALLPPASGSDDSLLDVERARQLVSRHMISEDFKAFHDASTYRVPEGLPGDFRIAVAGMMLRLETQAKDVRSLAI